MDEIQTCAQGSADLYKDSQGQEAPSPPRAYPEQREPDTLFLRSWGGGNRGGGAGGRAGLSAGRRSLSGFKDLSCDITSNKMASGTGDWLSVDVLSFNRTGNYDLEHCNVPC